MSESFAALLCEVGERGTEGAVRTESKWWTAQVLGQIGDEGTSLLDHGRDEPLEPGDTVAVRGTHAFVRVWMTLEAWRRGLSTLHLDHHLPDAATRELVARVGCRQFVGSTPEGVWEAGPIHCESASRRATCTFLRTSGTSGTPRVAVHAIETHIACARAAAGVFDLRPGDTWLLSLPTYHVGGLGILFRCLVSGAALAVPGPQEGLRAAMERYEPTHVSLVATQLVRLLDSDIGTERLRACRAVLVGGSAFPQALRQRALDAGVPLHVSYGSTETTAFVAESGDPEVVARPRSAGRPLPDRRVEISEDGEILVGGAGLFDGYLEDGEVASPLNAGGLYATGDLGRMDEDGVLCVEGRKDRLIISGGENIHPEEIENELAAVDGVSVAVVVGVEDAEFGMRPVAFVKGADLTSDLLVAALRTRLPGFKVPDAFYALPEGALLGMKPDVAGLTTWLRDPKAYGDLRAL